MATPDPFHEAVVTLWFVTAADPAAVLNAEPRADRGYGRKYLAQLNPTWPISVIGQFPLNRSVQASKGEFYIAGYQGVTIVQTVLDETTELSKLDPRLMNSLPWTDLYAFAVNKETGFGGIAHWHEGALRRSFCARRDRVYEDVGLPEPFESPFWSGERAESAGGILLPFHPIDLVYEADKHWLGVDISAEGPDLNVVGYAIDGRKEPRVEDVRRRKDPSEMVSSASSKLGLGVNRDYDDYETPDDEPDADELIRLAEDAVVRTRKMSSRIRSFFRDAVDTIRDRIRHTDRG